MANDSVPSVLGQTTRRDAMDAVWTWRLANKEAPVAEYLALDAAARRLPKGPWDDAPHIPVPYFHRPSYAMGLRDANRPKEERAAQWPPEA